MATDAAIDRVKSEPSCAFEKTRADLDRIEILAAGLAAFSAPIPNYEPRFQHLRRLTLTPMSCRRTSTAWVSPGNSRRCRSGLGADSNQKFGQKSVDFCPRHTLKSTVESTY
ncbi:MAG TPA: hypothetical protein VI358_15710 [Pseudolabrys sp.]